VPDSVIARLVDRPFRRADLPRVSVARCRSASDGNGATTGLYEVIDVAPRICTVD
jgi:hypothetical protein